MVNLFYRESPQAGTNVGSIKFPRLGAVGGHVQGSGRSHVVEKEAKEKQAEGEIRSADSVFCLLAMPTPSYM